MRYYLFSVCFFLTGCLSKSPITGKTKIAGFPIPFTGSAKPIIEDDKLILLADQLEKFSWAGIGLVIAGAVWWKMTAGFTGLGKTLFWLGWVFIGLSLLLPQIVAYLVLIVLAVLLLAVAYVVWSVLGNKD
jgi:hypothetical protein